MVNFEVILSIFFVRALVGFILIGILINELFNLKRKNKSDILWILVIGFSWIIFAGISDYGFFVGGLSALLRGVAIFSAIFSFIIFIAFVVIKKFKIINKILGFSTAILAFSLLIIVLIYRYAPTFEILFSIASLIVAILGLFTFIDFLIKTSGKAK